MGNWVSLLFVHLVCFVFLFFSFFIPDIFQVHMCALRTSTHVVTYHPCHILSVVKKETVVGRVICIALFSPRHKELAPQKYVQLEQKLRNDPRLSEYF